MQFAFQPSNNFNQSDFHYFESFFTPEECKNIRGMMKEPVKARIIGEENPVENLRKTDVNFISWSQDTDWIFRKITEAIAGCNRANYGFILSGFSEAIQLGRYSTGGHYSWHTDMGPGEASTRKLSVVIQLSDEKEYEGGDLQFNYSENLKAPRGIGNVAIFPAFMPHRVTPVTSGERFSLVAWIHGPPFM